MRRALRRAAAGAALLLGAPAGAEDVPTIDTEDASLGRATAGPGRLHALFGIDLRNGDFARGGYDDDAANLRRLPAHVQLGLDYAMHVRADGRADAWLIASSSNGIHAPAAYETARPRAWYESNTLVGVVVEPWEGFRAGTAYAIKTSPNAVSDTSHELSVTMAYRGRRGLGRLNPSFAATVHPAKGTGCYAQGGVAPSWTLGAGERAPSLSVPLLVGVGWGGFYRRGTGTLAYGSAGLALSRPLRVGTAHAQLKASLAALVRDRGLRRLVSADGETAAVVPYAQLGLSMAL